MWLADAARAPHQQGREANLDGSCQIADDVNVLGVTFGDRGDAYKSPAGSPAISEARVMLVSGPHLCRGDPTEPQLL